MKILYYVPAILLLVVVVVVEEGWLKTALLSLLAISILISKFVRKQIPIDEVEIDERVKSNIHYFSFGFILIMNGLLIGYYLLIAHFDMKEWLTADHLLLYLSISIFVPLYIIPSIAKRL